METGDLTEEELEQVSRRPCCVDRPCTDYACRAARELRRRRATEDFLRRFAAGLARNSTPGRIVAQALLRILDGGAS